MSQQQPPDWVAALDQMLSALADFAKVTRGYYQALVEQGFTEEQALMLTVAFQQAIQAQGSS